MPEGKWSKANTVEPGNYEELEYNWELMKKDWSKQLTAKEAEIWKRHDDLLWTTEKSEEKIDKQVADEFNITIKKVNEIFIKKCPGNTWI